MMKAVESAGSSVDSTTRRSSWLGGSSHSGRSRPAAVPGCEPEPSHGARAHVPSRALVRRPRRRSGGRVPERRYAVQRQSQRGAPDPEHSERRGRSGAVATARPVVRAGLGAGSQERLESAPPDSTLSDLVFAGQNWSTLRPTGGIRKLSGTCGVWRPRGPGGRFGEHARTCGSPAGSQARPRRRRPRRRCDRPGADLPGCRACRRSRRRRQSRYQADTRPAAAGSSGGVGTRLRSPLGSPEASAARRETRAAGNRRPRICTLSPRQPPRAARWRAQRSRSYSRRQSTQ